MDREGGNTEKMRNLSPFPHSPSISSPFPHSLSISSSFSHSRSIFSQPSCQAATSCATLLNHNTRPTPQYLTIIAQVFFSQKYQVARHSSKTRSSMDECSIGSNNHPRSTDLFRSQIIEFNRSQNHILSLKVDSDQS